MLLGSEFNQDKSILMEEDFLFMKKHLLEGICVFLQLQCIFFLKGPNNTVISTLSWTHMIFNTSYCSSTANELIEGRD